MRKFITLLLALLVCASFVAGCNKNEGTSESTTATVEQPAPAAGGESTATTEATATPAAGAESTATSK